MINHFFKTVNICELYMCLFLTFASIRDLYESALSIVLDKENRSSGIYPIGCPFCNDSNMDFTVHGYYSRHVVDLVPVFGKDNTPVVDEEGHILIEDFSAQQKTEVPICRIKCKNDGKTHALLFHFFVPYKTYTIRYVVYHLYNLYLSGCSMEEYCAMHNISRRTMKKWIRLLDQNLPLMCHAGFLPETVLPKSSGSNAASTEEEKNESTQESTEAVLPSRSIVRKTYWLKSAIEWIRNNFEQFYKDYLMHFKCVMFQTHRSPSNTVHQFP